MFEKTKMNEKEAGELRTVSTYSLTLLSSALGRMGSTVKQFSPDSLILNFGMNAAISEKQLLLIYG